MNKPILNNNAFYSLGCFVTAKLLGKADCRQGIVSEIYANGTFRINCESGDTYLCEDSPALVPYPNLYGKTKEWFHDWRKQNL